MLCMCVNFHRPEKKHKETFLISYFSVTKRRVQGGEATSERRRRDGVYQKSARRTHAVLLPNHWRRARVSRASHAWQICATNGKAKVGSLTLSAISPIPRERTYHTREPSRFVHALSARPHIKVGIDRFAKRTRSASPRQGIRVWVPALWSSCADGMESVLSVLSVGYT